MLPRLIVPGPFAGLMAKAQRRAPRARPVDLPRTQPALAVQRARVAGHVRRDPHFAPAEGETAVADAVDVGHQREAGGVQDLFEPGCGICAISGATARLRSTRKPKLPRQSKGLAPAAGCRRQSQCIVSLLISDKFLSTDSRCGNFVGDKSDFADCARICAKGI